MMEFSIRFRNIGKPNRPLEMAKGVHAFGLHERYPEFRFILPEGLGNNILID